MNTHTDHHRWSDAECWTIATDYLRTLIGVVPPDLAWDDAHHLQGHAHVGDTELIVIAPRDDAHATVVLTAPDWEDVRRSAPDSRRSLLRERQIATRIRLAEVLATARGLQVLAA
jgi:hypothetical protein